MCVNLHLNGGWVCVNLHFVTTITSNGGWVCVNLHFVNIITSGNLFTLLEDGCV